MSQRAFELPVLHEHGPVDHARASAQFIADEPRTDWHDGALWWVREKRDHAAASIPEWEALRALASDIKEHTLSRLDEYLEQFEANAMRNGVNVHWARDADEHNRIVHGILASAGVTRLVKSKSMLTEECGLNPYLLARGMEVVDTDLGERIVQLRGEAPSHIVLPAIHLRKEEVGDTFHVHLGTPAGLADPQALTHAAREHLRAKFLAAEAALTGVNFAVAETGGVVICTNEGNADLGMALAPVYVASLGIEKLVPRPADLGVLLRLLTRSATGQPVTVYTSHVHGPRPGQQMHLVLVDNGRTRQLGREGFWRSLKCIRCGACMNTCPVYRRSGGHSYGSTVPGPIGSVLTPGLDLEKYAALPFASTLCGSCTAVCPVKIDLDAQLYRWRQLVADAGHVARGKATAMRAVGKVLARPRWFRFAGALVRGGLRAMPQRVARLVGGAWGATRELPPLPAKSFRAWYRANHPNTSAIPADMRGDVSTGRHPTEEQRPASARREQGNTASVHTSSRASRDPADGRDRHRARDGQVARNPRDAIMRAVRAARPAPAPLPDVIVPNATQRGAAASELADAYATAARSAGADVVLGAWRNIAALVADVIADATRVASMVPEVPGTVEIADDPHAYAELDAFVARGTLGVGENGAVWLPASVLGQRAGLFLATRVVLLLDRDALVPDFHAAYARLDVAAEPFGVFVAGPSKTADIEQSLVVGAHGPKALTILLLDNAS